VVGGGGRREALRDRIPRRLALEGARPGREENLEGGTRPDQLRVEKSGDWNPIRF